MQSRHSNKPTTYSSHGFQGPLLPQGALVEWKHDGREYWVDFWSDQTPGQVTAISPMNGDFNGYMFSESDMILVDMYPL